MAGIEQAPRVSSGEQLSPTPKLPPVRPSPPPPPSPSLPFPVKTKTPRRFLDMATGRVTDSVGPDRTTEYWVRGLPSPEATPEGLLSDGEPMFDRLTDSRPAAVIGVAVDGQEYRWNVSIDNPPRVEAKVASGWAVLFADKDDNTHGSVNLTGHSGSIWFAPLKGGSNPRRLANQAHQYEVLGPGCCIFTVSASRSVTASATTRSNNLQDRLPGECVYMFRDASPRGDPAKMYVYQDTEKAAWNVLDGVESLPPPGEEWGNFPYRDVMTVCMLPSFGDPTHGRLLLASFRHTRSVIARSRRFCAGRHVLAERYPWSLRRPTVYVPVTGPEARNWRFRQDVVALLGISDSWCRRVGRRWDRAVIPLEGFTNPCEYCPGSASFVNRGEGNSNPVR